MSDKESLFQLEFIMKRKTKLCIRYSVGALGATILALIDIIYYCPSGLISRLADIVYLVVLGIYTGAYLSKLLHLITNEDD